MTRFAVPAAQGGAAPDRHGLDDARNAGVKQVPGRGSVSPVSHSQERDICFFENLVNKSQLAQHLDFSESYINKLMTFGLPRIKSGRAVRFRISEVMTWLERRNV